MKYSPYIAQQDVRIPAGDSLIIEPGVHVQMDSVSCRTTLVVNGSLIANGTLADSVYFESRDGEIWQGIHTNDSLSGIKLSYSALSKAFSSVVVESGVRFELNHCTVKSRTTSVLLISTLLV